MALILNALAYLLVYDLFFLLAMLVLVLLLAGGRRVAYAVLKRNFYGYFSNPTGYVFLCLFVLAFTLLYRVYMSRLLYNALSQKDLHR